nr:uncharacterized protein CTRU02_11136 [Colletotrichum truncatum]KAF6786265.1 hypothetical protein CTRU02_11136 [Colletotrichum truncatum]
MVLVHGIFVVVKRQPAVFLVSLDMRNTLDSMCADHNDSKRMTFDLWQHARILTYLTWLTTLSYLAVVGTITFSCLPFHDNWGVRPLPSEKCVFKPQNLLVTTFFSVVTDAAILCLPLPVLKEIRVPLYKKIFIAILICSGLFVIAAAIMRVAVTLGSEPSTITVNRWGVRECEIGLMAINAPILRPLFSRRFWQWHYRPPVRASDPMISARRSRTTIGRQRRAVKEDTLLGWVSSTRSRIGSIVGTRPHGSTGDEEAGEVSNEQELESLYKDGDATEREASGADGDRLD